MTTTGHVWFQYRNLTCCKICGIVKRDDDKNSPCKGPTKIGLRA